MRRVVAVPTTVFVALLCGASPASAAESYCGGHGDERLLTAGPCLALPSYQQTVKRPIELPWGPAGSGIPIRWSVWNGRRAVGSGVVEYPGPDGYVDVKFRVEADRPKKCVRGDVIFERVRVSSVRSRDRRRLPRAVRAPTIETCTSGPHQLDRPVDPGFSR